MNYIKIGIFLIILNLMIVGLVACRRPPPRKPQQIEAREKAIFEQQLPKEVAEETRVLEPPSQNVPQQGERMPPQVAIDACISKSMGDVCEFDDRGGVSQGVCNDKPGLLACAPNRNAESVKVDSEPNLGRNGRKSGYSIEQALSDKAQETTIAFDALAFLTGNMCSDSFLPPGKVADFFGFQYLRDVTPNGMGHNTDFLTNNANNVLHILNDEQKTQLIAVAKTQAVLINDYAYKRFPLIKAFRRQFKGDIPAGSSGLSKSAVIAYSEDIYELDAQISMQRAKLFGNIIRSLDENQLQQLDEMVKGGFASWQPMADQVDKRSLSHDEHVLVMTYASEMFGWYAGSVEADTYFAPERQGTYFGSFYMKDAPAMGKAGYKIDETITGNKGATLLTLLTQPQQELITGLVSIQKNNLHGIVDVRRAISTELRKYLTQESIDEALVISLATQYGALDGENVYYYATHFATVGQTIDAEQMGNLMKLRDLDAYPCAENDIYVYSDKINSPEIENSDFLFEMP
ncbi:hypothetical protein QUF58_07715 [Anaerolineales bacterium HSG24]|nr:hypothetical protein [Anaerolineales bacterium HSG24]